MNRVFTEQETQAIFEAEKLLRSRGLIVDKINGEQAYEQNFERISSYLELNKTPVTVEMILRGCELMKDQLCWKSKAQMEYDTAYGSLTTDQQNSFGAWWFTSGKKYVETDGERGFENATKIINWSKGRTFSNATFDLAVSNLGSSQGLHYQPVKAQPNPRQHADDGKGFAPKSETNLSQRRKAQQHDAAATPTPSQSNAPDSWKSLCDQLLRDGRHSQQSSMKQLYDNRGQKSWRELYADMKQLQQHYQRLINPRAV
jgi:hypothetical protein